MVLDSWHNDGRWGAGISFFIYILSLTKKINNKIQYSVLMLGPDICDILNYPETFGGGGLWIEL